MPGLTVRVFLQVHVVVCMYVIFKRVKSHDFIWCRENRQNEESMYMSYSHTRKACTCRIVILGKHCTCRIVILGKHVHVV
jgi:hypothetical protein